MNSPPNVTTFQILLLSVPSQGPINIEARFIQTNQLTFVWDQPPCGYRGGVITKYTYKLTDLLRNNVITRNVSEIYATIQDLTPFVEYKFQVKAFTSAGSGPYSEPIRVRTEEARK